MSVTGNLYSFKLSSFRLVVTKLQLQTVQGILFTDAVLDYAASYGPDEAQMRYFGTVYTSFGWNQQAFVPRRCVRQRVDHG